MSPIGRIICTLTVFLSLVYQSTCISCYYCNSANNSACLDVNAYDGEVRSRLIPIVQCDLSIPNTEQLKFFCRKITQTIFHPHRDSEVRVTRGCGWIRYHKDCYKDDNSDHLGTVCQCFDDLCNSADSVDPAGMTGLFLCFSLVLYLWR